MACSNFTAIVGVVFTIHGGMKINGQREAFQGGGTEVRARA